MLRDVLLAEGNKINNLDIQERKNIIYMANIWINVKAYFCFYFL